MDVRMRGANGLDVQDRLLGLGIHTPVVFMTAHGDIPMSVRAMKAGAVDFLTKPLREQDVLEAVEAALERDRHERQRVRGLLALQTRLAALSRREYEVLHFVTRGLMNKQIAAELGLSEVTIKMHRSSLMRKMGARTAAELIRMATALEVGVPAPPRHHRQAHAPVFIPVKDALETDRGAR
jgi:FixJ family two-component response regulator